MTIFGHSHDVLNNNLEIYLLLFQKYSSFCSKIDDAINCTYDCNKSQLLRISPKILEYWNYSKAQNDTHYAVAMATIFGCWVYLTQDSFCRLLA